MSAIILHHRSAPVMFDPPFPDPRHQAVAEPTSLPAFVDTRPRYEHLTDDQMALLDAAELIERLADRLGSYTRVQSVLRTVAMIHGEDLQRPLDRCLRDGVVLPANRICPRCGSDNS